MKTKLYNSKAWLIRQLFRNNLTPQQVADKCGVTVKTIYRKMEEFGIKK